MTSKRIQNFIEHCKKVREMGISYAEYENQGYTCKGYFSAVVRDLKKEQITDYIKEVLDTYKQGKYNNARSTINTVQNVDVEHCKVEIIRDGEGKIVSYTYDIPVKDRPSLIGSLDRNEMNTIYRLYSYYGDSLQQRIVSRQFPELSLIDFKRILRAFQITKASAPFAPHMFEEHTEEELLEIQMREKENSFLRKAEEQQIKNTEKLLNKYAIENIELKKQLENISKFNVSIPTFDNPITLPATSKHGSDLILHISDMHIGAAVTSGTLYDENIGFGTTEVKKRLTNMLKKIQEFPKLDTIVINLLGDNIDCCGVDGRTARLDHNMPENMDAREQANAFIQIMMWFIDSLVTNKLCSNIKVYAVPCGNHGGNYEYMVNKALLAIINAKYTNIETVMFEQFFGTYEFNKHTWVICHGKDSQYMKKGLPLNIDEKAKTMLYEFFDDQNIHGDNIHVIKGDLHSNNINSCKKFDYRNVLSLFGASDYSSYNFSRNSYGISYELFIGDNLLRGTFENL